MDDPADGESGGNNSTSGHDATVGGGSDEGLTSGPDGLGPKDGASAADPDGLDPTDVGLADAAVDGESVDVTCNGEDPTTGLGLPELCDGKDNDCDGLTDEDCSCDLFGKSVGVCLGGGTAQLDGSCQINSGVTYEAIELVCDGQDNDCDGLTDEDSACCIDVLDCDDQNPCTIGLCHNGVCIPDTQPSCCSNAAACDDSDACTIDSCQADACVHGAVLDCCAGPSACDDGDPCTDDLCEENACVHDIEPDCCADAEQCDDGDLCTDDVCEYNVCLHTAQPGCCSNQADCDDQNPCTTDLCQASTCVHNAQPGCCLSNAECDDGQPCTKNLCANNSCTVAPPTPAALMAVTTCGSYGPGAECSDHHVIKIHYNSGSCCTGQVKVELTSQCGGPAYSGLLTITSWSNPCGSDKWEHVGLPGSPYGQSIFGGNPILQGNYTARICVAGKCSASVGLRFTKKNFIKKNTGKNYFFGSGGSCGLPNCSKCLGAYPDCNAACIDAPGGYTWGTCYDQDSTDPGMCCACYH